MKDVNTETRGKMENMGILCATQSHERLCMILYKNICTTTYVISYKITARADWSHDDCSHDSWLCLQLHLENCVAVAVEFRSCLFCCNYSYI